MSSPQDQDAAPISRLLGLPPELRNRIYHFAVVLDHPIVVRASGHERSDLLRCSKQLHQEALKIFYYENEFKVEANYFDASAMMLAHSTMAKLDLDRNKFCRLAFTGNGLPHWSNVINGFLPCIHADARLLNEETLAEVLAEISEEFWSHLPAADSLVNVPAYHSVARLTLGESQEDCGRPA